MTTKKVAITPESILRDFVLLDHRLEDHPFLAAAILSFDGDGLTFRYATHGRDLRRMPAPSDADFNDRVVAALKRYWNAHETERYSYAAYPLMAGYERVGALSLFSTESFDFQSHMDRIAVLATLVSYAMLRPAVRRYPGPDIERVGGALRRVRERSGLTQKALSEQASISRISLGLAEIGKSPLSVGELWRICLALGLVTDSKNIVQVVNISSRLVDLLKEDLSVLYGLSPSEFEQFIAERLDRAGFDVSLTGNTFSKDGGIDLVAIPKLRSVGAFLLAGQVKHHRIDTSTGRADVDRLLAWRGTAFNLGLIVTNTTFSPDARWLARQGSNASFLRLRDFDDLSRWISDDFGSEADWREIPEQIEVAPGVVVQVPKSSVPSYKELWPDFRAL